jgi:response regulator NasT
MKVAIIKSGGYLDQRVLRLLGEYDINGDIITKLTRNVITDYDAVIFSYQCSISNMPKLFEQIVLEKRIQVVYITNTLSIGQFYNVVHDLYFNYVQEHKIDLILSTILRHTNKYLKQVAILRDKNDGLKEELKTLKLTNKAKRILINKGLSEEESHQFIIQKAMDLRVSKKRLVNLIIENKIDI